jgi:hypothetical protein
VARFYNPTSGGEGIPGPTGPAGADALWNFTGEWVNGIDYAAGDLVTFEGSLYYTATGVFSSYSPGYPGVDWVLAAEKGADGADADLDTGTTTIVTYNPSWTGTGLSYTGTPATGSYIKIGNLVTIQIDVIFTTVTNFGTGGYSLTLPFASKYHTDVYGGSVHKVTNQGTDHYSLKGHLVPASSSFTLWAIGSSAADQVFNNNTPANIDTDDKFHMSFTYICE